MTKQQHVIRESIDADAAIDLVAALSDHDSAHIEKKMYYPYFRFAGQCTVPALFGRRAMQINCLVDAVSGLGATADSYNVVQRHLRDGESINIGITAEQAERSAQRTVTHRLSRQMRVIAPFDLDLDTGGVVYKGYWIVSSGNVRAMVDSVNGSMHPLRSRAA